MKKIDQIVNHILNKIPLDDINAENKTSSFGLSKETRTIINKMQPSIQQIKDWGLDHPDQELVLGRYFPMKKGKPGKIILHQDNIGSIFWKIIMCLMAKQHLITQELLRFICYTTVLMVYRHEQFHHFCDLNRVLFNRQAQEINHAELFDRVFNTQNCFNETEEALAVAWSFHCAKKHWISTTIDISAALHLELFSYLFDYAAPGYKNWINYRSQYDFNAGLVDYLVADETTNFLTGSDVDVGDILIDMLRGLKSDSVVEEIA